MRSRQNGRAQLPDDFLNPGNRRVHQKKLGLSPWRIADDRQRRDSAYHGRNEWNRPGDRPETRSAWYSCFGWARNVERGKKAVEEIRAAGGKADFIASDLRGAETARELARKAIELGKGHVEHLRRPAERPLQWRAVENRVQIPSR